MSSKIILQMSIFLIFFNYLYLDSKRSKCMLDFILSILLSINFILGLLFWNNPIEKSLIHSLDALFVRITSLFLFYYIYSKKKKIIKTKLFYLILYLVLVFAILSYESSIILESWGSFNHHIRHFILHIFANVLIFLIIK